VLHLCDFIISYGLRFSGARPIAVFDLIRKYRLVDDEAMQEPLLAQRYCLVVYLIFLILCSGLTPDQESIEQHWKKIGLSTIDDRVHYTFSTHPQLVVQGPFHLLATIIDVHIDRTFSRGMIFDCLHAVYALYADAFFTADAHFADMKDRLGESWPSASRIVRLEDEHLKWIPTTSAPPPKNWFEP
jgi:hypothetical protein